MNDRERPPQPVMTERLTDGNSTFTLVNGETTTVSEYLAEISDDTVTDFRATKEDLDSLAEQLVKELLYAEFDLYLESSRSQSAELAHLEFRLSRVWDFLPKDVQNELEDKLRLGREKNRLDANDPNGWWNKQWKICASTRKAGFLNKGTALAHMRFVTGLTVYHCQSCREFHVGDRHPVLRELEAQLLKLRREAP